MARMARVKTEKERTAKEGKLTGKAAMAKPKAGMGRVGERKKMGAPRDRQSSSLQK